MRKLLLLVTLFIAGSFPFTLQAQNTWVNKAPYGGGLRDEASGFAIGSKGYIFSGNDTGTYYMDMWSWNSISNVWAPAAAFPGGKRLGTESVSLNGFGYAICGEHPSNCFLTSGRMGGGVCAGTFYNDVWKYEPLSDTWVNDTAFPGGSRDFGVAVADPDDSTIYYGTGNNNGATFLSDWWAFYTPTHTWTQMANFPGGPRAFAVGFFANGKIYVGTGDDDDSINYASNDFWQYTPSSNTWVRVADVPGMPLRSASSFSIGNFGYVCLGLNNSSYSSAGWRYNTLTNNWRPIANYGGGTMSDGVAFAIDSNGYVGTGYSGDSTYSQFWEYTFDSSATLGVPALIVKTPTASLYPNPANDKVTVNFSGINNLPATFTLMDILGNTVNSYVINNATGQATFNVSRLSSGIYLYQVTDSGKLLKTGKLIITR